MSHTTKGRTGGAPSVFAPSPRFSSLTLPMDHEESSPKLSKRRHRSNRKSRSDDEEDDIAVVQPPQLPTAPKFDKHDLPAYFESDLSDMDDQPSIEHILENTEKQVEAPSKGLFDWIEQYLYSTCCGPNLVAKFVPSTNHKGEREYRMK